MATLPKATLAPSKLLNSATGQTLKAYDSTGAVVYVKPGEYNPGISATAPTAAPVAPVASPVAPSASYAIKSGDTLSGIAAANKTDIATLMKLNPTITNPNLIYAGKSLFVY